MDRQKDGLSGRIWQRGASKGRKGSSNRRSMEGDNDFGEQDQDAMMSALQKSLIAETLSGARAQVGVGGKASLHEPSRPFTPGDMPRHLFHGNDYSNRPGSSYKMNNVLGQAADEFANYSAVKTQAGTNSDSRSNAPSEDVLSILERHNKMVLPLGKPQLRQSIKGQVLPSLDPTEFKKKKPTQNILRISHTKEPESPETPQIPSKLKNRGAGEKPSMKDYQDLIGADMQKLNLAQNKKQQQDFLKMQNEMRSHPNRIEEQELEDELEDQLDASLFKEADQMGIFQGKSDHVDYAKALKHIEDHISKNKKKEQIDSSVGKEQQNSKSDSGEISDNDELYNQPIDMDGGSAVNVKVSQYEQEYNEVIELMSGICRNLVWNNQPQNKDRKVVIDEKQIGELCPRIWALSVELDYQSEKEKQKCFLETLLKGSFSLLGVKSPKISLKISSCNIQLFFKIFDQILKAKKNKVETNINFSKVFDYLFETMRGLLIYAKEGDFDKLFIEENLVPQLAQIILKLYCEHSQLVLNLTSQTVNKKVICNDDQMYDLINYVIGTIKCFTQTSKEVQRATVQNQMIAVLSKAVQTTFQFGNNQNKQSMILVQISGTLRNLANVEESYGLLLNCKVLPKLCEIFADTRFKGHKELIMNISRLLSKVSIDYNCAEQLVSTKHTQTFLNMMSDYKDNSAVLIRIAFVLGNLTTHYERARKELCQTPDCFTKVINLAQFYLSGEMQQLQKSKEVKSKKYEEFSQGNIEDAVTKIVKLLANLSTEEEYANVQLDQSIIQNFMVSLVDAIDKRTIDHHEEFILNAISCITNILFYDVPSKEILTDDIRIQIFNSLKLYILATQNEEIQIETVRVLSNLSRHNVLCDEFCNDNTFVEALTVVLDHTLRDLVFYSVGIIINITLHPLSRQKFVEKQNFIPKLIDVLRDSNIEDIDLSKVAAKALHNMTKNTEFWSNESISRLEQVLESLGDELDSIMVSLLINQYLVAQDVASQSELEEIQSLRKLINALNNDIPEIGLKCQVQNCGRTFKTKAEFDKHMQRRHGNQQ